MLNEKSDLIIELYKKGKRLDGRKNKDKYREIKIEKGVLANANGSARVEIGNTMVLVGVKFEVMTPFPDSADEGMLMVNAEFSPIAHPEFEPGPPGETSIELSRIVDRGIRESKAIDMKKLCIKKGEKAWMVFIDIYIQNADGNLIDAAALASLAALNNAKLPEYNEKTGIVDQHTLTKTGLSMNCQPIACTFSFLPKDTVLVDTCCEEEKESAGRFSITVSEKAIHSLQKGGVFGLSLEDMDECVKKAFELSKDLRKLVI